MCVKKINMTTNERGFDMLKMIQRKCITFVSFQT